MSRSSLILPVALSLVLAACGDDTAPVITLNGAASMTSEFGDTFTDPGATVTDDKDDEVEVVVTGAVDTSALGAYTLSYDATDDAGNAAETVTRTVEVVDTTAPVISLVGDAEMTVTEGETFEDPGATVSDAADPDVEIVVTGTVDATRAGSYTLTYSATDASGNVAEPVTRTVDVVFDGEFAVASAGANLVLVGLHADGTLVERSVATPLDLEGYNVNQTFFGLAQHPVTGDIYATSFNDCGSEGFDNWGCWGNGRIDRFSIDANTITWEGRSFLAQLPLRVLPPTYDEGTGILTAQVLNQSPAEVTITSALEDTLPTGASFASDCDGETLAAGASCPIAVTYGGDATGLVSFDVVVQDVTYSGRITYISDAHKAYGLRVSDGEPTGLPSCAWDDFGTVNQSGACALTALAFSPDGTRVYVNEDDEDVPLSFALDGASGDMTLLSEGPDPVDLQGIAVHPDGGAIYNGSNAYEVDADGHMTRTSVGQKGNATEVIDHGGTNFLVSSIRNNSLQVLNLDDPLQPTVLTSLVTSFGGARFQHHDADAGLFVVVDFNDLATVSFDGETLTELATLNDPVDVGECVDCSYAGYARIVQVTADGSHALTGSFVNVYNEYTSDTIAFRGQLRSYAIAPGTGDLTRVDDLAFDGPTRAVLLVQPPQ